jgi:hypothetical protein
MGSRFFQAMLGILHRYFATVETPVKRSDGRSGREDDERENQRVTEYIDPKTQELVRTDYRDDGTVLSISRSPEPVWRYSFDTRIKCRWFQNISSGWYRKTSDEIYAAGRDILDQHWNETCDNILIKYVEKHGTFFTIFFDDIKREVYAAIGSGFQFQYTINNFDYYLATRAYEIEKTRKIWIDSYRSYEQTTYTCFYCTKTFPLLDCEPHILRTLGIPPTHCGTCNGLVARYRSFWDSDIEQKVCDLMHTYETLRHCEFCQNEYVLQDGKYKYGSFGYQSVDFFYPNLFLNVCPKCFLEIFEDCKEGTENTRLLSLHDLFLFTGEIPTQDFEKTLYLYKDHDSLLDLIKILRVLRTPEGYKEEFGSFFAALVKSGILPEGSRRMVIGTMILAKDGHLCLSIPEKEIDDFLHLNGVSHSKEVYYPDSKMRTDWEIIGTERRTFIEYFGLMNNKTYAEKAANKMKLAKNSGIELIEIYPDSDWKLLLSNFIAHNMKTEKKA